MRVTMSCNSNSHLSRLAQAPNEISGMTKTMILAAAENRGDMVLYNTTVQMTTKKKSVKWLWNPSHRCSCRPINSTIWLNRSLSVRKMSTLGCQRAKNQTKMLLHIWLKESPRFLSLIRSLVMTKSTNLLVLQDSLKAVSNLEVITKSKLKNSLKTFSCGMPWQLDQMEMKLVESRNKSEVYWIQWIWVVKSLWMFL